MGPDVHKLMVEEDPSPELTSARRRCRPWGVVLSPE